MMTIDLGRLRGHNLNYRHPEFVPKAKCYLFGGLDWSKVQQMHRYPRSWQEEAS